MYGVTRHQDWWGLGSALTNKEHDFDLAPDYGYRATINCSPTINRSDYLYSRCDSLGLVHLGRDSFCESGDRIMKWPKMHSLSFVN